MAKRIDFVSKGSSERKRGYLRRVQELKSKLRYSKLKYLNQELNRKRIFLAKKDAKMKQLHKQYSDKTLFKELQETGEKLKYWQRKHNRLKYINRTNRHITRITAYDEEVGTTIVILLVTF